MMRMPPPPSHTHARAQGRDASVFSTGVVNREAIGLKGVDEIDEVTLKALLGESVRRIKPPLSGGGDLPQKIFKFWVHSPAI